MDLLTLTDDQKKIVLESYDKMLFPELVRLVYADSKLDGRSIQGRSIRAFLVGLGKDVTTTKFVPKGPLQLTEEQKTFIENNGGPDVKTTQICQTLWPGRQISPLHAEWRAVIKYRQETNPDGMDSSDTPVVSRTYQPPSQLVHVVARVNSYVTDKQFDAKNLRPMEKKCMEKLLAYLSTRGFVYQASQYVKQVDRDLFESSFVRYVYDKSDLTATEVDRYSELAAKIVSAKQIERMLTLMSAQVEDYFTSEDVEQRRMGQTTVESMNVWRLRLSDVQDSSDKLYKQLETSRADRVKNRLDQNATVLNLLEAWKDPEKRKPIIEIAEKEKKKDMDEFDRLTSLDDTMILIAGMTREEMEH